MGKDLCVEGVLHSLRALEQVEMKTRGRSKFECCCAWEALTATASSRCAAMRECSCCH